MQKTYHLDEISQVAADLIKFMDHTNVYLLYGDMGAGKTTLIKAICSSLGVNDAMSSPTFSLINVYATTEGDSIYHFDLYRLLNTDEAVNIGIEEYLSSGFLCLIEWPQIIESLLPSKYLEIHIKLVGENQRTLAVKLHG